MKKKILFLEDESYYKNFGLNEFFLEKYKCDFNGMKNYKISDRELREYSMVVSFLYTNPICNFIIAKAKNINIKTLLVSDGIYDFANSYKNKEIKKYNLKLFDPILHDFFLVVGEREAIMLEDTYLITKQYLPKRVLNLEMKPIKLRNNKKVLITTANNAYFDDKEKRDFISLLRQILNILNEMKIDYIFRIFDDNVVEELKIKKEKNYIEGKFEDVLELVDYVITTPSSITLTSMYHQRGVAQLLYRDTPLLIQSGWNILNTVSIKETIISLLNRDEDRINFQNKILKTYLPDKKFDEVLSEILEEKYEIKLKKYIKSNEYNMLNSIFNINLEYYFRKIYLKLKTKKLIKIIKVKVK